jgi:hypothetical protein
MLEWLGACSLDGREMHALSWPQPFATCIAPGILCPLYFATSCSVCMLLP